MRDWWEDWRGLILGMLSALGFAAVLVGGIVAVSFWASEKGCDQIESVQGVPTQWHWSSGCVYVDPDYIVGN